MQSRKDLRKRNNRSNLYLIVAGIIIVVAIIAGVTIHNSRVAGEARARKFATTHFNPNVTIYGVKVGNLTVAKATDKINQKADNTVWLQNNKVEAKRNPNIQTISQEQVGAYFKKQHTTSPNKNNYQYDYTKLVVAHKKLTKVKNATVTYELAGKNYDFQAKDLVTKASYQNDKYHFDDDTKLTQKLNTINKQVSTLNKSYKVIVPNGNNIHGKKITVTNKSYGWGIYVKKAQAAIEKAFTNGTKIINGKNYIYGTGFSTYAHGYDVTANNGIGNNYIVVSINNQEIWVIRHGKLAVRLNDVVTGTYAGGKGNRTPTGVWYIQYKESPSVLRGFNDDGSKYASKVQYWMPFTLSGCGFHDASWRSDWSKTAYLRGGSHGCVNIRPSEIHSVWSNVIKDEPVIVYN